MSLMSAQSTPLTTETGRIVSVDDDSLLLDMVQQSTCSRCIARNGCGQNLMNQMGTTSMLLRVVKPKQGLNPYQINDFVTVAIPSDVIVKVALITYLVPLFALLVFSGVAHTSWGSDLITILFGIVGLTLGTLFVRFYANEIDNDPCFQPTLVTTKENFIQARKVK